MPYMLSLKLGLQELELTQKTLQLADHSLRRPKSIVNVILVMNEDSEVPIILGRPSLATSGALLDIQDGMMTLRASA